MAKTRKRLSSSSVAAAAVRKAVVAQSPTTTTTTAKRSSSRGHPRQHPKQPLAVPVKTPGGLVLKRGRGRPRKKLSGTPVRPPSSSSSSEVAEGLVHLDEDNILASSSSNYGAVTSPNITFSKNSTLPEAVVALGRRTNYLLVPLATSTPYSCARNIGPTGAGVVPRKKGHPPIRFPKLQLSTVEERSLSSPISFANNSTSGSGLIVKKRGRGRPPKVRKGSAQGQGPASMGGGAAVPIPIRRKRGRPSKLPPRAHEVQQPAPAVTLSPPAAAVVATTKIASALTSSTKPGPGNLPAAAPATPTPAEIRIATLESQVKVLQEQMNVMGDFIKTRFGVQLMKQGSPPPLPSNHSSKQKLKRKNSKEFEQQQQLKKSPRLSVANVNGNANVVNEPNEIGTRPRPDTPNGDENDEADNHNDDMEAAPPSADVEAQQEESRRTEEHVTILVGIHHVANADAAADYVGAGAEKTENENQVNEEGITTDMGKIENKCSADNSEEDLAGGASNNENFHPVITQVSTVGEPPAPAASSAAANGANTSVPPPLHRLRLAGRASFSSSSLPANHSHKVRRKSVFTNASTLPESKSTKLPAALTNGRGGGHIEQNGRTEPLLKCQFCLKTFTKQEDKRAHELLHTGGEVERPFICSRCSQAFVYRKMLEEHQQQQQLCGGSGGKYGAEDLADYDGGGEGVEI